MSEEAGSVAVESVGTNEGSATENSAGFESGDVETLEQSVTETPPKRWTVKIDGNELEVDEDELLRGYQTTQSAQKKFNEAAKLRRQAEEFITLIKQDPRKVLSHPDIGVDVRALALSIMEEAIEEEQMSPQEKELRETKRKLAEYEEAKRAEQERMRAEEEAKYTQMYEEEYTASITNALETSGLPKTASTVKQMAQYMLMAMENGLDVKPHDVVEFVKRDYIAQIQSLFGSANEDTILALLGDNVTNKVVKGHLKKVKVKEVAPKMTEVTKPVDRPTQSKQTRTMTRDEWYKNIAERAKS